MYPWSNGISTTGFDTKIQRLYDSVTRCIDRFERERKRIKIFEEE